VRGSLRCAKNALARVILYSKMCGNLFSGVMRPLTQVILQNVDTTGLLENVRTF
jgi:hypothetical protein